jgi:hypothetical protein
MEFELANLKLSPYGALPQNLGKKEIKMVILMFFIVKVLVIKVLLQPNRISNKIVFNELQIKNLKIVGSILCHLVMDCFDKLFSNIKGPSKITELDPFLIMPRQTFTALFYKLS